MTIRTVGAVGGGSSTAAPVDYKTNWLTKCIHGRYAAKTALTAITTYQIITELESPYEAIRVAIPNIHTATVTGVKVTANTLAALPLRTSAVGNTAGPTFTQWTWQPVTFGGNASVDLPPQLSATRPSWTLSDVLPLTPVARTDGGTRPLVCIRLEYQVDGVVTGTGASTALAGWNVPGTTLREYRTYSGAVAGVTSPNTAVTSADTSTNVPMIAIQYLVPKPGKQILLIGDSTIEGAQATPYGAGTFQIVCTANSTPEAPIEYFNAAIFGDLPVNYLEKMVDVKSFVKPTSVFYLTFSVNQVNSTSTSDNTIKILKQHAMKYLEYMDAYYPKAKKVMIESYPSSSMNLGVFDLRRTALDTLWNSISNSDYVVTTGYADSISGPIDANSQRKYKDGYTTDNIHMNNVGYAAGATYIQKIWKTLI